MLVALSGSQGAGKSTTLNRLKELGFQTIERKTSRSILSDWGVTLNQVNNNHDLTVKFQEEILKRKHEDEKHAIYSHALYFTERTYADLWVYSLIALGKDNQYSDWLNNYYLKCIEYQQTYDFVYYLTAGHFAVEHDAVRGSNHHYSKMVDLTMREYISRMTLPGTLCILNTPDLEERVHTISTQTTHFQKKRSIDTFTGAMFPLL